MAGEVVFGDLTMIDGQIGVAVFEIAHRVTACVHHIGQKAIGSAHRLYRAIDEQRFGFIPVVSIAVTLGSSERAYLEFRYAFPAFDQIVFGSAPLSSRLYRTIIFLAEGIAQRLRATPTHEEPDEQQDDDCCSNNDGKGNFLARHGYLS